MLGHNKIKGLLLMLMLFLSVPAYSQVVKGKVLDKNSNEPIIGASVQVKGTNIGTMTDIEGEFELNVKNGNATLQVSYIGYTTAVQPLEGKKSITILLKESITELEDVVVIGYGVQKKSDLTGAIASVNAEDIASLPATNVMHAIQGKAAGVEIVQNSGAPGASSTVRIRGMGTINNSDPLYVVDGIPMDNIDYLSADDIESIEILKDASSAAIYGSRAANGVVLVVTKSGKNSEKNVNITFNTYLGWQESWKNPGVMNKEEFAYFSDFVNNLNIISNVDESGKMHIKPETKDLISNGVDWWDELSRSALMQKYNLSLYGGSDKLNYYVSANLQNTDGLIKESNYERKSFNGKLNAKLAKNVTFGTNLTYAREDRRVVSEGTWGVIKTAINYNPLVPIYDQNESYNWTTPVENLRRTTYDTFNNTFIGQVTLDWEIIKGLKFSTRASYSNYSSDAEQFNRYNTNPEIVGSIRYDVKRQPTTTDNVSWDNILTYTNSWNDHNLSVMVGHTMETCTMKRTYASGTGYGGYDDEYNALNFAQFAQSTSGYSSAWTALGFLGRVNYDFKNRYLLQVNFRADGSSRFAKKNRWGYFPSVSVGWKINSESFMKDVDWISLLKLRAGWGQLGNNRIGNNAYCTYVGQQNATYIYGLGMPSLQPGMSVSSYGNPDILWERTQSTSVGLDFNVLSNRISTSIDYFVKDTHDMLVAVPIVYSAGYTSTPMQNAGSVRNRGWEFQVSYKDHFGDFSFELSGNLTKVKNEVTALGGNNDAIYGGNLGSPNSLGYVNKTIVGAPIACFYGWKTDGIMSEADFDANGKPIVPVFATGSTYAPGDMKFVDVNRDGKIDDNDRTFIGDQNPDFYYGFNVNMAYKGFDLSMFFQGVAGNEIYDVTRYFRYSQVSYSGGWDNLNYLGYSNVSKDYFDKVWRPTPDPSNPQYRDNWGANPGGTVPMPSSDGTKSQQNFRNSDFYVQDGSYLRLKNLQLGYTFPKKWVNKLSLINVKIYASVSNVFTITDYDGLDPEVGKTTGQESNNLYLGIDQGVYPQARTYMYGLIIDF